MESEKRLHVRRFLDRGERLFLVEHVNLPKDVRDQLESETSRPLEVWMDIDQVDDILEALQEYVQLHGFDEDYEITPNGERAQALIDKLFPG